MLDQAKQEEVKAAIAKDSKLADNIIVDAAAKAKSGLLAEFNFGTSAASAEPLTVQIEREATKKLAQARAAAAIPQGQKIPGLGDAADAIEFQRMPSGRLKPSLVTIEIASSAGRAAAGATATAGKSFSVIRRGGKYLVQSATGKTVFSDTSLALALLIFALLVKREQEKENARHAAAMQA